MVRFDLRCLTDWASQAWPDYWHNAKTPDILEDALSAFLVKGADHSKTFRNLKGEHSAILAHALLIGIGRSGSHPITEIEDALGVSLPPEAHQ
ncbi:hypothetical protein BC777_1831 [Yoonia maricola]|uniref:Uncharacterized protein n=1 Tax=Yoonia maricola TaxID=420999 RepID=A0A2M8WPY6_9RHOB|nr:hypothetical protein [Yoonia maricola]PJI92964.1 hypothetical protein BC777_1831 [Yoonia maricola]